MKRLVTIALLLLVVVVAPETRAMFPAEPMPKRWSPPGLFLTVYDWGLGGHNCYLTCTETALMVPTGDDILGWTAACPSAWLGRMSTTVVTIWGQEYWCLDAFGRERDRALTTIDGKSVYRIDIAYRPAAEHPWSMEYVPYGDWSREWRPMWEFEAIRARAEIPLEDVGAPTAGQ